MKNKLARVIIEVNTFDHSKVVVRVPVLDQKHTLIPIRITRNLVSKYNISGTGALAIFFRPDRKRQCSNYIPYFISKHLLQRNAYPSSIIEKQHTMDLKQLNKRFSDVQLRNDGSGRFLVIEFIDDGRNSELLGIQSFDSMQCMGSFHRNFHKHRANWKIRSHASFLEKVEASEIRINYASRFTRKLVADNALPREDQWKKELRVGIQ